MVTNSNRKIERRLAFEKHQRKLKKRQKPPAYNEAEILSFYGAINGAYEEIKKVKPDIIVAPLRGAEPLIKSIRLVAGLEKASWAIPKVAYVKTGQFTADYVPGKKLVERVEQRLVPAPTHGEKKKIIDSALAPHAEKLNKDNPHIMLLDEAMRGGSITESYEILREFLRERYPREGCHALQ